MFDIVKCFFFTPFSSLWTMALVGSATPYLSCAALSVSKVKLSFTLWSSPLKAPLTAPLTKTWTTETLKWVTFRYHLSGSNEAKSESEDLPSFPSVIPNGWPTPTFSTLNLDSTQDTFPTTALKFKLFPMLSTAWWTTSPSNTLIHLQHPLILSCNLGILWAKHFSVVVCVYMWRLTDVEQSCEWSSVLAVI